MSKLVQTQDMCSFMAIQVVLGRMPSGSGLYTYDGMMVIYQPIVDEEGYMALSIQSEDGFPTIQTCLDIAAEFDTKKGEFIMKAEKVIEGKETKYVVMITIES